MAGGALLLSLGAGLPLAAQFPQPRLRTIFPPGGQSGTAVSVRISGADFGGPFSLSFSDVRIQARPKPGGDKPVDNEFIVDIPAEVETGVFEVWAAGKFGMSNSRLFAVGTREERADSAPGHTMQEALPIPTGATIHGRAVANRKNYYRLFARQGQRVIVACFSEALDSKMDPVIRLLDAAGRSLQEDRRGRLLDYTAAATGALFIAVSDLTYRGGEAFFYRLSIHAGPYMDCVLPLSAAPGSEQKFHVFGRNLPQGEKSRIVSAAGSLWERAVWRGQAPEKGSTSLAGLRHSLLGVSASTSFLYSAWRASDGFFLKRIDFSPLDSVVEAEIVSGEAGPQAVRLPVAISGMFYPKRDRDVYEFDAKKGERYRIEVRSHRLGYGTSPLVVVDRLEVGGEAAEVLTLATPYNPGERAFPLRAWDPQGWLTIEEDGRYRLTISDLFNTTQDRAGLLYELRIRPPAPGFRAFSVTQSALHRNINRQAKVESSVIVPGQVLPFRIRLHRVDGFQGPVKVVAEAAPKGIRAYPVIIPAGAAEGVLLVEAEAEAKAAVGELVLRAEANIGGTTVSRLVEHGQVVWEVGDYNNEAVMTRLSPHRRLAVADVQPFPVSVFAGGDRDQLWRTALAGVLKIPIQVNRQEGFQGKLAFQIRGVKPLAKHPGVSIEKGKNAGVLRLDLNQHELKPGRHEFYLYGEVKGKYRREPGGASKDLTLSTYSPSIQIEVFPAPFEIEVAVNPVELVLKNRIQIPVKLRRRFGFEGQIEVTPQLLDREAGIQADSSMLRNDQFDLTLKAPGDSRTGPAAIELKAQGKWNGKPVTASKVIRVEVIADKVEPEKTPCRESEKDI